MRFVIDSMIAVMLLGILGAVVMRHHQVSADLDDMHFVHESLARLHEQAIYRGALELEDADGSRQRFLRVVQPQWFDGQLPLNVLVDGSHPWIDVAPVGDMSEHPPDPVCARPDQAGFWYNPNRGIFRARVEPQVSERQTLDLYNRINSTALASIQRVDDPARSPLALSPADQVATHASFKAPTIDRAFDQHKPATTDAPANVLQEAVSGRRSLRAVGAASDPQPISEPDPQADAAGLSASQPPAPSEDRPTLRSR